MELRLFDTTIEPLGAVDELDSLIWDTKYFDAGTISLLAPVSENNKRLIVEGNIVTKHDGQEEVTDSGGGIWRRAAQITYVNIKRDENGQEQIEAKGYMLSWWLNKRCVYPQIISTATNQSLINTLITNNCGSGATEKRQFPQFTILEQEIIDGTKVEYMNEICANLRTEVKARAQASKLGYDILINERSKQFGFYLYKGKDLTASNNDGNTPCIFSREFDNINDQEYTASIENCGNYIYVLGEADDNGSRPVATFDVEYAEGLELTEVYCDASDIARRYTDDNGEEVTIPLEDYLLLLKTRGVAELESYGKVINFESEINAKSSTVYKNDFNLGDRVTCKETGWGIQIDARVTGVKETYQKGAEEIAVTFGDSLPTLTEQIRKVR